MTKLYLLFSIGIAFLLHVLFGWQFAVVGAVVAGALIKEWPVLAGTLTITSCWGGIVLYNFTVATDETMKMVVIMSAIVGDLPAFATVLITLLIAAILGAAGGWLGSVPAIKK